MIKDYYVITKPGIIYGNALTAIAGFVLASHGDINFLTLVLMLVGISLVIASGCVFNNYIDRDIDSLMERTKNRPLVKGRISLPNALLYGSILGIVGFTLLTLYTNMVTVFVAFVGIFVYVIVYSLWLKRTSTHSALIGSISGAVPIIVGYLAVTGSIDVGAIILFLVLAVWQMPHSLAIALYRLADYKSASIPVIPLIKGTKVTQVQMLFYAVLFLLATSSLTFFGYTGVIYLVVMATLSSLWVIKLYRGITISSNTILLYAWAKRMFGFSIGILVVFCVMIMLDWK